MEGFMPKKFTRKMAVSKVASVWDLLGKFAPMMGDLKLAIRKTMKLTEGWSDAMPDNMRSKWAGNLWKIEGLKGIKFCRARMPTDAVEENLRRITLVDAAEELIMIGLWVGFIRIDGTWSNHI